MDRNEETLDELARRARQGSAAAAAELRRHLGRALPRIVRQALTYGTGTPSIDHWIRAEVGRHLPPGGAAAAESAQLCRRVAQQLTQAFVDRLRGCAEGRPEGDTVRGP
jgi:hypothetical protein